MLSPISGDQNSVSLIVNADDFGLTEGVNLSIQELYLAGAISSATLMANGRASQQAVAIARMHPGLGVGCHIVLLDGYPVSDSLQIRSLCGRTGQFHPSLPAFLFRLYAGQIATDSIFLESVAQIRRLQDAGVYLTHVDTHKHTHMFPPVARAVMRAAKECGVHAIRNPFESSWSTNLLEGAGSRTYQVRSLNYFRSQFLAATREFKMRTTDGSVGIADTGSLNASSLYRMSRHIPGGVWELVCHPGYYDAALRAVRTRLTHSRDIERHALLQVIPEAVQSGHIALASYKLP